jgi:hypothetical protein
MKARTYSKNIRSRKKDTSNELTEGTFLKTLTGRTILLDFIKGRR